MAVRNDFTAGEVLAAADLNDTFASKLTYPTGGNDGDLLAKDGTDAEWIAPDPGGLTLITSATLAGSETDINGCFTSTYDNYLITLDTASASSDIIRARMLAGGVAATGATDYFLQEFSAASTTLAGIRYNEGFWRFFRQNANFGAGVAYIFGPAKAQRTRFTAQRAMGDVSNFSFEICDGLHNVSTAYDGIRFIPAGGSLAGVIRIYGLRK